MREAVEFKNKQGEKLVGVVQGEGKKCVILCHGFTGNKMSSLLVELADALVEAGFVTLRFDFSGNGASEGNFEDAHFSKESDDLLSAIEFMRARGCEKIGLVGHSMGGSVALLTAVRTEVDAVASLAAPALPNGERLREEGEQALNKTVSNEFIEDANATSVIKVVKAIQEPVLLIHGEKDDDVLPKESEELFAHANEPKKLVIIPGADHDLEGNRDMLMKEVVAWMTQYLV